MQYTLTRDDQPNLRFDGSHRGETMRYGPNYSIKFDLYETEATTFVGHYVYKPRDNDHAWQNLIYMADSIDKLGALIDQGMASHSFPHFADQHHVAMFKDVLDDAGIDWVEVID